MNARNFVKKEIISFLIHLPDWQMVLAKTHPELTEKMQIHPSLWHMVRIKHHEKFLLKQKENAYKANQSHLSLVYPRSNIAPAKDKTLVKAVKHPEILHVKPSW